MVFETLKGTKDFLPEDMIKLNEILEVLKKNFERYGFSPFDTPLIEYIETLTNKYDEDSEIVQEIFKVTDRGDRNLGLRYDLTIPLCRYIASQKQIKLPFKRYAIGKVFRDGPIKVGRMREFIQCDADIVGIKGEEAEAETLKMFFDSYKELKIVPILEINNNKILKGAFLQKEFKEENLDTLTLSVDKLKKIGKNGVLEEIKQKGLNLKNAEESINILMSKNFDEIKKTAQNDLLIEGINELENLVKFLDILGVEYRINFSMSRGFNYYTGNIWEMYDKTEKVTSSIGSGGRYDKGIGNYIDDGREFPAFGVSFGIVPILACLDDGNDKKKSLTNLVVAPLTEDVIKEAINIAEKFRAKNVNTEICYDFKLKKAFEYADYIGAEKIIVFGKKDLEEGSYKIKDLKTGKETLEKITE